MATYNFENKGSLECTPEQAEQIGNILGITPEKEDILYLYTYLSFEESSPLDLELIDVKKIIITDPKHKTLIQEEWDSFNCNSCSYRYVSFDEDESEHEHLAKVTTSDKWLEISEQGELK